MSTTEQSREVAMRYIDSIKVGDVPAMDQIQHRDATWWVLGGHTMTREVFMGAVTSMFGSATGRRFTLIGMTVEGERAAFELEGEITFPDRVYRNSYHNLLIIRDGLIVEGREYMDTMAVQRAFGDQAVPEA